MKKFVYLLWTFVIFLLGFFWSLESTLAARKIPYIGASVFMAALVPLWFIFNFKWALRAAKIPFMLHTINGLFARLEVRAPFSERLAMAFDKIDVYSKLAKIRRGGDPEKHIAQNFYLLPAIISGNTEGEMKSLAAGAFRSVSSTDFYPRYREKSMRVLSGALIAPFLLSFALLAFILAFSALIDTEKILNSYLSEPTLPVVANIGMFILCGGIYFFVSSFMLCIYSAPFCAADPEYLARFADYLRGADFKYTDKHYTLKYSDKVVIFILLLVSLFTLAGILKMTIKAFAF